MRRMRDSQVTGCSGAINLVHDHDEVHSHWATVRASSEHIDVHSWNFTLYSFRLILAGLQALGLARVGVAEGCEKLITLHKTFHSVILGRLELLKRFSGNV